MSFLDAVPYFAGSGRQVLPGAELAETTSDGICGWTPVRLDGADSTAGAPVPAAALPVAAVLVAAVPAAVIPAAAVPVAVVPVPGPEPSGDAEASEGTAVMAPQTTSAEAPASAAVRAFGRRTLNR